MNSDARLVAMQAVDELTGAPQGRLDEVGGNGELDGPNSARPCRVLCMRDICRAQPATALLLSRASGTRTLFHANSVRARRVSARADDACLAWEGESECKSHGCTSCTDAGGFFCQKDADCKKFVRRRAVELAAPRLI